MRKVILPVLTILCAFGSAAARGDNNIDVAVVFSSDTSLSVSEKLLLTAQIQVEVSLVLLNSQMNRTVTLKPMVTTMSYNATEKKAHEANLWLKAENANPISQVYFARNFLNSGGADLILMVVDHWSDAPCGTTAQSDAFDSQNPLPPLLISANEKEEFAFAAYAINESPNCRREITVAHEIGHLLYAEHEIVGGTDNNNDTSLPAFDNHGITLSNGQSSVMRGSADSQTQRFYSGVGTLSGGYAHVNTFIVDKSWNTVAAYRPIPPPPPPFCIQTVFSCNQNNQANVFVSFDEPPGYTATGFSVEQKRDGGSWSVVGGLNLPGCVPTAVNIGFWDFRVTMQTQFGSSQCLILYVNDGSDCNDGDDY